MRLATLHSPPRQARLYSCHLGTIDDDPQVRPERHVFVASKPPWHDIADALPRFKIYPGFEPEDDAPSG